MREAIPLDSTQRLKSTPAPSSLPEVNEVLLYREEIYSSEFRMWCLICWSPTTTII